MATITPPGTYFTVVDAMTACSFSAQYATTFDTYIFIDVLQTCRDISKYDINDALRTFSILTVAQGQIKLLPSHNNKFKSFNQLVKYHLSIR